MGYSRFEDLHGYKHQQGLVYPARRVTGTPHWNLGKGSVGKRLVGGPVPMGSSRAQPEEVTWVRPHVGPPPAGGAVEVQCSGDRVTV